ncbi:MAG: hypothetical protein ABIQ39_01265 [Ilumatobacteraceae bacterium]
MNEERESDTTVAAPARSGGSLATGATSGFDVTVTAEPVVVTSPIASDSPPASTAAPVGGEHRSVAPDPLWSAAGPASQPYDARVAESESYDFRVECPGCGTLWEGNDMRPHAEWFCATCDYPLFWARSGGTITGVEGDGALARLPGTDGRAALSSISCPACGEHNPPVPTANCLRCGAPLTPLKPVVTPDAPAVVAVVPPPLPRRRRIWPWVVATCVLAVALIVMIVVLVRR